MFVGRLNANKNLKGVLEALHKNADLAWSLDVFGDGSLAADLRRLAKRLGLRDRVHFRGHVPREAVLAELAIHDVFVLVSHRETLGLAYLEAMASGALVVGSRNRGIDGVVVDGQSGLLADPDSPDSIAQVLRRAITMSAVEREEICQHAQQTVAGMTEESCAKNYMNWVTKPLELR